MTTHRGGCHCGQVSFAVQAPADIAADQCNCSVCRMAGYLHLIVSRSAFQLLSGEDAIETYTYNTNVAQHYFCRHCGIKSFYIPRSHPSGISVNVNCLDPSTIRSVTITPFDGQNWEQNAFKLSSLSD